MFGKFRKNTPETQENSENTLPFMSEKVGDKQIEHPQPDLNRAGDKNNVGKKAFLFGGMILGMGVIIAGLMGVMGNSETQNNTKKPEQLEMVKSTQHHNFNDDLEQIRQTQGEQSPAASDAAASDVSVPAPDGNEKLYGDVGDSASTPAPAPMSPEQRKLLGGVLVSNESDSATPADSGGQNNPQDGVVAGLQPDEMAGLNPENDEGAPKGGFGSRLNPTQTASVRAERRGNLTYLLLKGTNIACTLDTKIVTTLPGFTRCVVNKDVYSANGKVLLLERGSKVAGEQASAMLQGQARVFVLWNEVETPNGVKINLASPAAGQLGEAGTDARVKYHFWRRFGGAIMISMIGDLGNYVGNRKNSGSGQTFNFENTSESAQDMATEALKNSINIPPTGYVNQGSVINIMVARDVDFGGVYERVNPYMMPAPTLPKGTRIRQ
jgi:hypothetical protein